MSVSNAHCNKILASFDTIIDIDIGLMRLIKMDYNTDYFFQSIINSPEYIWKDLLRRRPSLNPLYILMGEYDGDKEEEQEDLYKQFMEQEYQKILELSPIGTFATITDSNMYSKDLLQTTILCKSQVEKDILDIKGIKYKDAIIQERKTIYTKKYEVIVEKSVWDLDQYINLERNTIMIPDYGFNVLILPDHTDTPLLPKDILDKYGEKNEFRIYTAYGIDPDVLPD